MFRSGDIFMCERINNASFSYHDRTDINYHRYIIFDQKNMRNQVSSLRLVRSFAHLQSLSPSYHLQTCFEGLKNVQLFSIIFLAISAYRDFQKGESSRSVYELLIPAIRKFGPLLHRRGLGYCARAG